MIAKSGVLVSIKKFALLRKQYLQWRISSLGKTLCTKCKVYKEEDQFCKDVRRKSGLQAQCPNDYINTIYKDKTNEPPISTPMRNLLLF